MVDRIGRLTTSIRAVSAVFRNPQLARLQVAWAAVSMSMWAFVISLGVYAFEAGGAALVGIAALVRLAPGALASPLAGVLGDRHSRRLVLIASTAISALALGGAAAAAVLDASPAIVLALAGGFTVASCAYIPAEGALLPLAARTPQELAAANVAHSVLDNVGFLAGGLTAALVLAIAGPDVVFALAAAGALAAALVLLGLTPDRRPAYVVPASASGVIRETALGLEQLIREPVMRLAATALVLLVLFEGAADVMTVLVALDLLGLGDGAVGLLNAAWGVGAIAAGAGLALLLERGSLAAGLLVGCLVTGLAFALPAVWPAAGPAYLAWLGIGVGFTLTEVAGRTLLQRLGADETLARALGSLETVRYVAMAVGSVAAPLLAAVLGIRGAALAIAAVMPLFALLSWAALRRLDTGAPLDERGYALLRADPIFAPLPVATLERLTHALDSVEVAPGECVIVQGEVGEHFFLLDEGRVEVLEDGERRCFQGPGSSFGEIALLRDIPRTATVRAAEKTRVLALGRESFLEAVTGQPRSREAAAAVMDERLARPSPEGIA